MRLELVVNVWIVLPPDVVTVPPVQESLAEVWEGKGA
jgi:hypothetical protein